VTAGATSLRVRRYGMMVLPRCPYVSTLAGTKVWPGCRWPAIGCNKFHDRESGTFFASANMDILFSCVLSTLWKSSVSMRHELDTFLFSHKPICYQALLVNVTQSEPRGTRLANHSYFCHSGLRLSRGCFLPLSSNELLLIPVDSAIAWILWRHTL
jgi:hypothetical protein